MVKNGGYIGFEVVIVPLNGSDEMSSLVILNSFQRNPLKQKLKTLEVVLHHRSKNDLSSPALAEYLSS